MWNRFLIPLLLLTSACAHEKQISMPVEVKVPVKTTCGPSGVPSADARPVLDVENITSTTQIDKDVDWLVASLIRLKAYAMQLERERDQLKKYEGICAK